MKAIVIAAGMGRRLAPYTDDRPKCLVPIRGRTILERQLEAYRAVGIRDVVVIRGYLGDRLSAVPGLRFHDNPDFRKNNILGSLMCGEADLDDDVLVSYSDIVFHPSVVADLCASRADFGLITDREWQRTYVGRSQHPVSEGELVRLGPDGAIAALGKGSVPRIEDAFGEYIGLMRMSRAGAAAFRAAYHAARAADQGGPFIRAPRFEVAYTTDLMQWMIDRGTRMEVVAIDGKWREIDTTQDLEAAEKGGDFEL